MSNFIPKIIYGDLATEIIFELPPEGDNEKQKINSNSRTTKSTAGVEQTQFNYNEETISPKFVFVPELIKAAYETFFIDHASKGLSFQYFEHEDEVEFITVTLARRSFSPVKVFPDNTGGFIYEFGMTMRRVL